mgnify:CR=1 FL=1
MSPLLHDDTLANGCSPEPMPKKPAIEPNVRNVVLGDLLIKPWYPSFYPEELVGRQCDRLYVCQWCFKYSRELMPYLGHVVSIHPSRAHYGIYSRVQLTDAWARKSAPTKPPHRPAP